VAPTASRFAAVYMFVTSTVGRQFGVFPRWLSLVGYGLAVILFAAGGFAGAMDFVFPVWLIAVSVTLLVTYRTRREAAADPATGTE
jgi:hypothetical protein